MATSVAVQDLNSTIIKTARVLLDVTEFSCSTTDPRTPLTDLAVLLSGLQVSLHLIKLSLTEPASAEVAADWWKRSSSIYNKYRGVLSEIQQLIEDAKLLALSGSASQSPTPVRFDFESEEVTDLVDRLIDTVALLSSLSAYVEKTAGKGIVSRIEAGIAAHSTDSSSVPEQPGSVEAQESNSRETTSRTTTLTDRSVQPVVFGLPTTAPVSKPFNAIDVVVSATKPSEDEQMAMDLITRKTWKLTKCRSHNVNNPVWKDRVPDQPDFVFVTFQLNVKKGTLAMFYKGRAEKDWRRSTFLDDRVTINDKVVSCNPPPYLADAELENWCIDEFTFLTSADAGEAYFCLSTLIPMVHRCWKMHLAAFSCLRSDVDFKISNEIDRAAWVKASAVVDNKCMVM